MAPLGPTTPDDSDLPKRFPPAARTVPALLAAQARRHGDRPLVVMREAAWSFADALAVAGQAARRFADAGVRPGDRVAVMCGNRPEFLEAVLGAAWLGAVAVPINTASRGAQLAHILANCGARLMVIEHGLTSALAALAPAPPALEEVWVVGGDPADRELPQSRCRALPALGAAMPAHAVAPGDMLAILYTSGTTGLSKGVCCPHAQYFWWGVHTAALLGVGPQDVLLTTLPLFHTNALNSVFQALLTGATLVVEPRFSASDFFPALARHRATVTYVLGAMVPILLSKAPSPADRVHTARIALAPAVPARFQQIFTERFGIGLIDGYGSTETNFAIGSPLAEQRPGFMGRLRPGFDARVVDADDNDVGDGAPGELVLRADAPFAFASGYFALPDKTVEAWRNLWFHTGDRVMRDADGYFRFLDRTKDAIRRRGENISSVEVEQVLAGHPGIENAAVFPVPSDLAEDEVMAAVVLRPGATLSAEQLLDFCQPRLPYFAVPRYVEFVAALPTTENGKVTKFALRARGVTAATWDREAAGYKLRR